MEPRAEGERLTCGSTVRVIDADLASSCVALVTEDDGDKVHLMGPLLNRWRYAREELRVVDEPALHPSLMRYVRCMDGTMFITHPLLFLAQYDTSMTKSVNEWFEKKLQLLDAAVATHNWSQVVILHERPHRWSALRRYEKEMSDEVFAEQLLFQWDDSSNTRECMRDVINCLRRARGLPKGLLMDKDTLSAYAALPEQLRAFRGNRRTGKRGLGRSCVSWSMDMTVAIKNATRVKHSNGSETLQITSKLLHKDKIIFLRNMDTTKELVVFEGK